MKALMILIALMTAPTAFAQGGRLNEDGRLNGHYARESGVRLFGPKEMCDADGGEYDEESRACFYRDDSGNTITIDGNDVSVSTVWGAAHQASFRGRIVRIRANVIEALEAEEIDMEGRARLVPNGCRMHIRLNADGTATSIGGDCGESLSIENAKRK